MMCTRCQGTGTIIHAVLPDPGVPPPRPQYERLSYGTMRADCLCLTIGAQAVIEIDQERRRRMMVQT